MHLSEIVDDPAPLLADWPTEPMRWSHAPDHFASLLTLEEVNEWIDAGCLPLRNVEVIEDGRIVERHTYQGQPGMPARGYLRAHLDAGGTLSLRRLETLKPSIARLSRAVQATTGYAVHTNAYVTPGGCQGFRYHYDEYVTLILQVHGRKVWHVHPPFVTNPTETYDDFPHRGFTPQEERYLAETAPAESYLLEPGNAFWLPRGFIHAPITDGPATSVHLTVGIQERTRHWMAERIMTELLATALTDPALRSVVPPAELTGGPVETVNRMRAYLVGLLLQTDPAELAELARRAAVRPV